MPTTLTVAKRTESPRCPINVAARRSGLTAHVIRAWERRYEAVKPDRTAKARRLYSEWEVQRLVLLRQAVELGHRISEVANLAREELHALVGRETVPGVEASPRIPMSQTKLVENSIAAAAALDSNAFLQSLLQATRTLAVPAIFMDFVEPLLREIGERWRDGRLRIAHEHFASAHLRTFLGDLLTSSSVEATGPAMVVSTPFGQNHELGALMAAITAMRLGWDVLFAGPGLPAEEIVFTAEARKARAVSLSLCYPSDEALVEGQLMRLRDLLPAAVPIFIGGSAAAGYLKVIASIGARRLSLQEFAVQIEALRAVPA